VVANIHTKEFNFLLVNDTHAGIISTKNSSCTVRVIPTNEDLMIARHTRALLLKGSQGE